MGALVGLLGLAGLGLAAAMLVVKAVLKKGWEYKKIGVLAVVALALFVIGLVITPSTKENFDVGREAGRKAATEADSASSTAPSSFNDEDNQSLHEQEQENKSETNQTLEWNTKDVNVESNGNLPIAVTLLNNDSDIKSKAESVDPAAVMKAPWKYYGKIIKFTGVVGIAQEYPPGSDISDAVGGSEVGELVITTEDMTFIDYLHIGSTGEANVGDSVTIYGYPIGIVEVENKLGGTTQELCVIGKLIEKQ